jgi:hypothetical protein
MKVNHAVYEMLQRAKQLSEAKAWALAMVDNNDLHSDLLKRIKTRLTQEGTNEKGEIIGVYKPSTERINPKKHAGSHYTLFDTGEFYASLYVGFMTDYFFIDGDGDKGKENLFDKFGEGIIGLTEKDKEWLGEIVITKYLEYVENTLFGN